MASSTTSTQIQLAARPIGWPTDADFRTIRIDLPVVRYLADRTAVMRQGKIVELGGTESLMSSPQHEYSRTLLAAAPALRMRRT